MEEPEEQAALWVTEDLEGPEAMGPQDPMVSPD